MQEAQSTENMWVISKIYINEISSTVVLMFILSNLLSLTKHSLSLAYEIIIFMFKQCDLSRTFDLEVVVLLSF